MKPFNNLWEQFCYADLMLTGHVSECAVLILSTEILNERGALPVGEVGKILQETTGNTSLSSRLKEKYGGLKKFLERFPDEYLICNDHPFNPRVFVKKGLAHDEIDQISRGIVPVHLSSKLKKQVSTYIYN
jgi:hypothetical protein